MKNRFYTAWPYKASSFLAAALAAIALAQPTRAASVTLQGNINTDDAVRLFNVTFASPGVVDFRSYGYGGGLTASGALIPRGGFDTILTLFDASGVYIDQNDDGAGVATDPATGQASDARITANLAAGNYILALTQYDNFSLGNLADGFTETGNPHFTADPSFAGGGACPGDLFRDISGTSGRCRSGNWALSFDNVESVSPVSPVPEPSGLPFAGGAVLLSLIGSRRFLKRRIIYRAHVVRSLCAAAVSYGALTTVGTALAQAQTNCPTSTSGPDYCHVSDYLGGDRNLLRVTDLQAFRLGEFSQTDPNNGYLYYGQDIYQIHTSGSQQNLANDLHQDTALGSPAAPLLSFSAHMFAQPSASTLTTMAAFVQTKGFALWLQNVDSLNGAPGWWSPLDPGDNPTVLAGAVGDLTGDGYDDLALSFDDGKLIAITPKDLHNASANFNKGAIITAQLQALAIGDFNGDGRREIAGVTYDPNTGGVSLIIYTVDPATLAVTQGPILALALPSEVNAGNTISRLSLSRGRFNSPNHDQLAIAFGTGSGSIYLEVIDFAVGTLNAQEGPRFTASTAEGYVQAIAAQFGLPANSNDQILFHNSGPAPAGGKFFKVFSVDPTSLVLSPHAGIEYDFTACALPLLVGNFDNRQADPSNPGSTVPNPSAQIAIPYCNGSAHPEDPSWDGYYKFALSIYNVDPKTFDIIGNAASTLDLGSGFFTSPKAGETSATIVATDLQGRSLTLSDPTKISISNSIQPTAVIGVPPMHVDFIDPGDGNGPRVFNVSVVPDGFKTTYNQQSSSNYASNTTNTTSWSFGAKETASVGFTVGDPEADFLKVSDTLTAAQDLKGSHEHDHGAYNSKSFNISATTGFGDEVSYTDSQFNIWVYEVLGKKVCPARKPNCQPNEQVPLTIQFSAPGTDSQQPEAVQGQALQWYQPPWEPGNVFSYPANLDQLKSHYPDVNQLTNDTTGFLTDGGTISETATWSGTGEESDSTGLEQNYSFENDFSVNGAVEFAGIGTEGGYGLDLSGSFGFNSLTKTTTTLGKSTGLEISKPGTFPAFQNYGYAVNPYIMGLTRPGGYVDNQPLSADIQTVGVLRAVYTANPLSADPPAGGWWQQAYTAAPDVALNHPSRWTYSTEGQPAQGDPPTNCLLVGDNKSMDCAELNPRFPRNPWLSIFHFMRGFFISSGVSPGQGPQLEQAKGGDKLTLQARVYNYSLCAMPDGAEVHVRFYFMPWNPERNLPVGTNGESYLISEQTVGAILPFNDSSGPSAQPNWTLVTTTFDTSKFKETQSGNVHLVFWVMVWMQDASGNVIAEMPGHGITAIPPAGTVDANGETMFHFAGLTNQYQGATDFEECQPDNNCYSNNLGLYKQVFYLSGPSLGAPPPATGSVELGKVTTAAHPAKANKNTVLSAVVFARGAAASGVSVNFYDGDPNNGGRLFAVERVPHIDANTQQLVETIYESHSCGVHQLFGVVNRGKPSEMVRRIPPIRVPCASPALAQLRK